MQTQVQHNSDPEIHYQYGILTGVVVAPPDGPEREDYIKRCLASNTVAVLTQRGQILPECFIMSPRMTPEDGFLEMLGIPESGSDKPDSGDPKIRSDLKSGLVLGTAVLVFPLNGSLRQAAVMPLAIGALDERFRLWDEHQRRDRHLTPHSTFEEMIDGEGGYNLWFKTYTGNVSFAERPIAGITGTSAVEGRAAREQRLTSTTRIRITPDGKLIISLAKQASELETVKNLERVRDQFSELDNYDDENSPHIVIDPDSGGNGDAPTIHVDSKNATLDMDKDKIKIRHKRNHNEIIMKEGVIQINANDSNGNIELNGSLGRILSTKNLPACMVTGAPFNGSSHELTKG